MSSKLFLILAAIVLAVAIRRWWQHQPRSLRAQTGEIMSRQQALQVLGLAANASRDDIIDAHRRLIQKLHPDRGGSDYLAAQINQAKDVLLKQAR